MSRSRGWVKSIGIPTLVVLSVNVVARVWMGAHPQRFSAANVDTWALIAMLLAFAVVGDDVGRLANLGQVILLVWIGSLFCARLTPPHIHFWLISFAALVFGSLVAYGLNRGVFVVIRQWQQGNSHSDEVR